MRFSVFFTLLVATFVVSCDSFISAKRHSLDDRTYDSSEVRRLRGNGDIEEERGPPMIAEQVASSATKIIGLKTEEEAIAEEKKILQKKIVASLDGIGRKHTVTKNKIPYEELALLLLGAAVAGTTVFAIHHTISTLYDPAPPTTKTTISGSA